MIGKHYFLEDLSFLVKKMSRRVSNASVFANPVVFLIIPRNARTLTHTFAQRIYDWKPYNRRLLNLDEEHERSV